MWKITKDGDVGYFTDEQLDKIYWMCVFAYKKGKVFTANSTLDMVKFIEQNGYKVQLVPDTILVRIKNWVQDRFPGGLFTWMKK